jgi:hypothetical protein
MSQNLARMLGLIVGGLALAVLSLLAVYRYRAWFHANDHIGLAQAASSIVLGVVSTLFALAAVVAALRAADASEAQVKAALAQAESANAQRVLAEIQLREQIRPVLHVTGKLFPDSAWNDPQQIYLLENTGTGSAINLDYHFFEVNEGVQIDLGYIEGGSRLMLPPGQKQIVFGTASDFSALGVYYEDSLGRLFQSGIDMVGNNPPQLSYGEINRRPEKIKPFSRGSN